jgi:hypothetical protein
MAMAGVRDYASSYVLGQDSNGGYWSSTYYGTDSANSFYFYSSTVETQLSRPRAYGFTIRAFRDKPVAPDSSWTTLYQ